MTNEPADVARQLADPDRSGPADAFAAATEPDSAAPTEGPAAPTEGPAAPTEGPTEPAVVLAKPGDPTFAPPAPPQGPLWPNTPTSGDATTPAVPTETATRAESGIDTDRTASGPGGAAIGSSVGASTADMSAAGLAAAGGDQPGGNHTDPATAPAGGDPATMDPAFGAAFNARYGLVRPLTGRHFAGVCAALARATNTDPVLWRVLLAVLTVFGGVGLLAYLIGWLLMPAEGDTASPLDAVFGRGRSRTSAPVAVVGAIVAIVVFTLVVADGPRLAVVGALIVLGAAVLLSRGSLQRPAGQPSGVAPGGGYPPVAPVAPPTTHFGAAAPARPTTAAPAGYPSSAPPTVPQPAAGWPQFGAPPQPPVYRPPFAPHGPFVPQAPYQPPKLGLYGPYPPHLTAAAARPLSSPPVSGDPLLHYPGLPYSGPPAPKPKQKRPKSRLGPATVSAVLLALGILTIIDISGVSISGTGYPALALTVIGAGLVTGAWLGRARLLILLGIPLVVGLLVGTVAPSPRVGEHAGADSGPIETRWMPASVAEIGGPYAASGRAELDLSLVDFTGQEVQVEVSMEFGRMTVKLPPTVDAEVRAKVGAGDARVLGDKWGGLTDERRTIKDLGLDGEGGGKLILIVTVEVGDLEVTR